MKWIIGILILVVIAFVGSRLWLSTNPPVTPEVTIIPGTEDQTYTNSHLSFSIRYPATASTTADFSTGYLPLTQSPVMAFELPKSMFSGTNLVEAGVYIGATTTRAVMAACTDGVQVQGPVATSSVTIGGQQFLEIDSTQAGAGNLYQQKTFRAFQNGSCLEIVELLHSGNIGNYTPGTVQPFDQQQFSGILDAIVHTYYPIPTGA